MGDVTEFDFKKAAWDKEIDSGLMWRHPITGEDWYTYTASYEYLGTKYSVEYMARSDSEADAMLKCMSSGTVDGVLIHECDA